MTNQIELRHLLYFAALSRELHYRKAAERLHISQSALSQQIKQLESILKVDLFERTNRRVALTEVGQLFFRDAMQVLTKLELAGRNLERWKAGNTGQIGIGFVASAMESILPDLLKRFHHDCPHIGFNLHELSNHDQHAALIGETLDLGFMRTNHLPDDFASRQVYTETFSLVLPANHAITAETFTDIGQFRTEPFILFPNDQSQLYYQQIISLCADQGFMPIVAHKSIHAPTIFRLVENGMGLSIIPSSLATSDNRPIRFIELKNIPQRTALYAVWRKENHNPVLPYLLEMLPNG